MVLALKTRSSNGRKIDIFPKGITHGFGPKIANVPTLFFLSNIGQENAFNDILARDKKFKTSKNSHFSKGVNP